MSVAARKTKAAVRKKKKPAVKPRTAADLLVEIGTEELPPRSLARLSRALGDALAAGLEQAALRPPAAKACRVFATPRRLAVLAPGVRLRQADREQERRGPALAAAWDRDGKPTPALLGFARSCGVAPEKLGTLETDKGAWVVHRLKQKGRPARELLPGILDEAIRKLPIPKRMRWGALEAEFVRPVHWLVLLHGDKILPATILGIAAGRATRGHRFHHPGPLRLASAGEYEARLRRDGRVIADFARRRDKIRDGVRALAKKAGGVACLDEALLDEVTGLVEWPVPLLGEFDKDFLEVPPEVLGTTMQDNQKYFPVRDRRGRLKPFFITVSNIQSRQRKRIIEGNARVLRARFADARFFWDTDRQTPLAQRVDGLKEVVFHRRLGSIYDKCRRVIRLATVMARELGADTAAVERAARLAKADLMSGMVGEFPALQGVMGRYYARHDGEPGEVAVAIEEHYRPRHAGDALPQSLTGRIVAVADKLDTLTGIFGVGEVPTGEKDPYALRRAALGVLRIMIEGGLDLDLRTLLRTAVAEFEQDFDIDQVAEQVYAFMMERLRAYYADQGVRHDVFESVLACRPARPLDFDRRVRAVMAFRKLKEAEALTAANKRIHNILKQGGSADWNHVSEVLLEDPRERSLAKRVQAMEAELAPLFAAGEYTRAMKQLARLRPEVDAFFDHVMVMVDEEAVRDNRLALLHSVRQLFLQVADLSRLQG